MMKQLKKGDAGFEKMKEAIQMLDKTNHFLNQSLRDAENRQTVISIHQLFAPNGVSSLSLSIPLHAFADLLNNRWKVWWNHTGDTFTTVTSQ